MATKSVTKTETLARDEGLIVGFPKAWPTASVLVDGVTFTAASAVTMLQGRVQVATNVVTTKAAYLAAVKVADAEYSATAKAVSGLVEAVYVAFGDDPAALAEFQLPVRKGATKRTPAQYEAAAAKAKATRAARHTMGPKQKAAITGTSASPAPAAATGTTGPTVGPVVSGTAAGPAVLTPGK